MLTNKDYCDYETCVALKELGFDENCLAYYDSEDNVGLLYNEEYSSAFYPVQYTDLLKSHNARPNSCIDAPTLYDAQKWLREEKGIDISVTISPFEYFATIREFVFWQGEYSWEKTIHPNGGKTYEEALSEGIKEAVKILKEK